MFYQCRDEARLPGGFRNLRGSGHRSGNGHPVSARWVWPRAIIRWVWFAFRFGQSAATANLDQRRRVVVEIGGIVHRAIDGQVALNRQPVRRVRAQDDTIGPIGG